MHRESHMPEQGELYLESDDPDENERQQQLTD